MSIKSSKGKPADYLKEMNRTKDGVDYEIDLGKLKGAGEFPCPKCGTTINPDDDSDTIYKISGAREGISLTLDCLKCNTKTRLKF